MWRALLYATVCVCVLFCTLKRKEFYRCRAGEAYSKNKESDSTVTLSYLVSDASYHSAIVSFTSSIFVLRCFIVWIMKRPILIFSLSCGKRW